ncbi:PREDICTED: protein NEDD1-like [Priapulus caudatus]|uniref:Protein NEDD1-like n=1 Tax=Priapulus caudatus TaxID=37621 RepID=A0ABM1E980_PRICU|nr:PREDICTED: protein NEDD1-like [Priapulus caudatus]
MRLATAGNDIKLWDSSDYSLQDAFNPHASDVACVDWSRDGSSLASSSKSGEKLFCTRIDGATPTYREVPVAEGQTCVAYNSLSRYLLSGGRSGVVHIYDLKTSELKKRYEGHKSEVTCLQFNHNDLYVAAGASSGAIILFNVVTGVASAPLTSPNTQAVRRLQYSHIKRSLLACVSDDGATSLWDVNARQQLHRFAGSHHAPVTDLCFSSVNDRLLISSGLDSRVLLYDVIDKK